ncbi:hypothetical protein Tco_1019275 [Tanacetum coccineum]|uniref:Reverse transcriptase domain-containing protein n=1 Tax=Tanacetum coccineum TaxID=301880 RepID=A0ABQ5FX00_9ASTR
MIQDVLDLYRPVKERFETASPEGYDILLWGDLITVFEPSKDDEIWKAQQDYTLINYRLFDSCGVHVLLMDTGISIHMLIENTYPLTQEMLSRMLSRRLEVDHEFKMAYELLSLLELRNRPIHMSSGSGFKYSMCGFVAFSRALTMETVLEFTVTSSKYSRDDVRIYIDDVKLTNSENPEEDSTG